MAVEVKFEDFSIKVTEALKNAAIAGLEEAASEVESAAQRNSRKKTGQLKGSWSHTVDESKMEATIGSPLENAIWEELGTGEYAVEGGHGGGYWVFVKGGGGGEGGDPVGKRYTLQKAKQIVAMMRADGLDAYYTNGKKPNRTLQRAFDSKKGVAKRLIERSIQEAME